jgi:hypothetical protein
MRIRATLPTGFIASIPTALHRGPTRLRSGCVPERLAGSLLRGVERVMSFSAEFIGGLKCAITAGSLS